LKQVFKHQLDLERTLVETGSDAKVCLVGLAPEGKYCIWVEDTPNPHNGVRRFEIYGTGHEIPDDAKHVGSFVEASFVWHVYERLA
jgi:hypothetical protein